MLVASWLRDADGVAWVGVDRGETDATRFWNAVAEALRASGVVDDGDPLATLTPAPAGGQEEFLERLLDGLDALPRPVVLVVDDLHELHSPEALDGLEQLLCATPAQLRTIILSRRDPEARPPPPAARRRAAGDPRRRPALHPEETGRAAGRGRARGRRRRRRPPPRAHRGLGGGAPARRALARAATRRRRASSPSSPAASARSPTTCSRRCSPASRPRCARCCCAPASSSASAARSPTTLTGRSDGTRILHELEEANALVVAVDVARTWFRYHHLLADLLRLELRRGAPAQIAAAAPARRRLARRARRRGRGDPPRRSSAATGSSRASCSAATGSTCCSTARRRRSARCSPPCPASALGADAELATIAAADLLAQSRWAEADRLIAAAQRALPELPVGAPPPRRDCAGQRPAACGRGGVGELDAAVDEASALLHGEGAPAGVELEAFALMNLGIAESWTLRLADAEAHLEHALALAPPARAPLPRARLPGDARHGGEPDPPRSTSRERHCARRSRSRSGSAGRRSRSSASPS